MLQVAPKNVADRVYLGLVPSSRVGWRAACSALKDTGGIIHVHHNVTTKPAGDLEKLSVKELKKVLRHRYGEGVCVEIGNLLADKSWKTKLLHCEFLKQYAPHVDHMVYDILCSPDGLN